MTEEQKKEVAVFRYGFISEFVGELVPLFGQVGGGNKVESRWDYAASLRAGPA